MGQTGALLTHCELLWWDFSQNLWHIVAAASCSSSVDLQQHITISKAINS